MSWIEVNGASLRYDLSGNGREPLVLIHEVGGCMESWDDVLPAFQRDFRVLRYDQRGFGMSERTRVIEMDGIVADLVALLDALQIAGPVHLAGCAMGAAIALAFAGRHPARGRRDSRAGPRGRGYDAVQPDGGQDPAGARRPGRLGAGRREADRTSRASARPQISACPYCVLREANPPSAWRPAALPDRKVAAWALPRAARQAWAERSLWVLERPSSLRARASPGPRERARRESLRSPGPRGHSGERRVQHATQGREAPAHVRTARPDHRDPFRRHCSPLGRPPRLAERPRRRIDVQQGHPAHRRRLAR